MILEFSLPVNHSSDDHCISAVSGSSHLECRDPLRKIGKIKFSKGLIAIQPGNLGILSLLYYVERLELTRETGKNPPGLPPNKRPESKPRSH